MQAGRRSSSQTTEATKKLSGCCSSTAPMPCRATTIDGLSPRPAAMPWPAIRCGWGPLHFAA